MNTIGDRIKHIRKEILKNKSQKDFGDLIGLKANSVSCLETGTNNLTEQTANAICRECGINKDWLLTGEGEPTIEACQEERYAINIGKLQRTDNETIMRWVNAIAETKPELLTEIEKFMKKILEIEE